MWRLGIVAALVLIGGLSGAIGVHGAPSAPDSGSHPVARSAPAEPTALHRAPLAADSNVSFEESGLPSGTPWEVSAARYGLLFAETDTSTAPDLNETLSDGTYNISAEADRDDYRTYGAAAELNLTGTNATIGFEFFLGYDLTFDAVGLPTNVSWNISLVAGGLAQNRTVAGDQAEFWIPTGNYTYLDGSPGYVSSTALGGGELTGNRTLTLDFGRAKVYPGTLSVTLNARSADFYLNGQLYANVPSGRTAFSLPPGIWTVYVTAPGYLDYFNSTSIRSNQTAVMDVTLIPTPGNPNPELLTAFNDVLIAALVTACAIIGILFWVASRRLR